MRGEVEAEAGFGGGEGCWGDREGVGDGEGEGEGRDCCYDEETCKDDEVHSFSFSFSDAAVGSELCSRGVKGFKVLKRAPAWGGGSSDGLAIYSIGGSTIKGPGRSPP